MAHAPKLLTRKEAAEYLDERYGIYGSVKTLDTYVTRGHGPRYCKISNRTFYAPADLDSWVMARTSAPTRGPHESDVALEPVSKKRRRLAARVAA